MKSFYSTIYAVPNVFAHEKIAVGLLLINEERVYFDYSGRKLKVIRKLLPAASASLLEENLEQIKEASKINNIQPMGELQLKMEKKTDRMFSQAYIDYLSRYSRNLIQFSEPLQIDLEANEKNFEILFNRFVGKDVVKEKIKTDNTIYKVVKTNLFPKVKDKFNFSRKISRELVNTFPYPMHIDLIGKNDLFVAARILDFNQKFNSVKKHFDEFTTFHLSLESYEKGNKYFLIGNEPDKEDIKQHKLWNALRSLKDIDYIPFNETDKIEEYASTHEVRPAFED